MIRHERRIFQCIIWKVCGFWERNLTIFVMDISKDMSEDLKSLGAFEQKPR